MFTKVLGQMKPLDGIYHWYISLHMDTAKLFKSGRSQAVRLPKEFRFEGDEVMVTRLGAAVVLLPKNHDWAVMFGALYGFTHRST